MSILNRVNGWQRIGIILSASWLLIVVSLVASEYSHFFTSEPISDPAPLSPDDERMFEEAVESVVGGQRLCSESINEIQRVLCEDAKTPRGQYRISLPQSQPPTAFIILTWIFVPIIGGWLIAYALVFLTRWVVSGFRK